MDAVKLLGSLLGNNSMGSNVLGGLLGGQERGAQRDSGGLGGLGALMGLLGSGGGQGGGGSAGGLGNLLGGLLGGQGGQRGSGAGAGALGALMGLLGDAGAQQQAGIQGGAIPASSAPAEAQQEAEILIRAMCNAAKSDGRFDDQEQQAILGRLGEVDESEIAFLRNELQQPLDVQAFSQSVPRGLEEQVYTMSVMAIKLDEQSEAKYLGQLAQGLGISGDQANRIHQQLGAPKIFR